MELNKVIQYCSDKAEYYGVKAQILYNLQHYQEAIEESNHALHLDPSNPEYYRSKAMSIKALGYYEDALPVFWEALIRSYFNPDYLIDYLQISALVDRWNEEFQRICEIISKQKSDLEKLCRELNYRINKSSHILDVERLALIRLSERYCKQERRRDVEDFFK